MHVKTDKLALCQPSNDGSGRHCCAVCSSVGVTHGCTQRSRATRRITADRGPAGAYRTRRLRRRGWITAEVAFSLGVLGVLLTVFAASQSETAQSNAVQLFRQQCTAAAEAQLDSLAASGKPLEAAEIDRLWPGVRIAVEQSAGAGDWEGLTLATVIAEGRAHGRDVKIRLARYLAAAGDRP